MLDLPNGALRANRSIEVAGTLDGGKLHMVGDEDDMWIHLSIVVDESGNASGTVEISQDNASSPSVLLHAQEMFGARRVGPEFRGVFAGRAALGFSRGMAGPAGPMGPGGSHFVGGGRGGVAGGGLAPWIFRRVFDHGRSMGPRGQAFGEGRPDSWNRTVEIFCLR